MTTTKRISLPLLVIALLALLSPFASGGVTGGGGPAGAITAVPVTPAQGGTGQDFSAASGVVVLASGVATAGIAPPVYGGTGQDFSASTGIPIATAGTFGIISTTGTSSVVRKNAPALSGNVTIDNSAVGSTVGTIGAERTTQTAATAGNPQFSALNCDDANGWNSTAGASQLVQWCWSNEPAATTAGVPTSNYKLYHRENGGAWTSHSTFGSAGGITVTQITAVRNALGSASTPAYFAVNNIAATSGVTQQWAPFFFDTYGAAYNATSGLSETHEWRGGVRTVTNAGTTSSNLVIDRVVNGGTDVDVVQFNSVNGSMSLLGANASLTVQSSINSANGSVNAGKSVIAAGAVLDRDAQRRKGMGLIGENYNLSTSALTSVLATGVIYGVAVGYNAGDVVTRLVYAQSVESSGAVTLVRAGLADINGVMLATTADVHATFAAAGSNMKEVALSSPYTIPSAGLYYHTIIAVGAGTMVTLSRGANNGGFAGTLTGATGREYWSWTGQTDLPTVGNSLTFTSTVAPFALWSGSTLLDPLDLHPVAPALLGPPANDIGVIDERKAA